MRRTKVPSSAGTKGERKKMKNGFSASAGVIRKKASEHRHDATTPRGAMDRLFSVEEHSPVALIEWSPADLRISRFSKSASRLFGWRADEAIGRRTDELNLVLDQDSARARAAMVELVQGKCLRSKIEQQNVRRDGSVIRCEWYHFMIGEKASTRAIVSLVLDVTERDRAERALRETKEQLARIIDAIPNGFVTIDRGWRYTDVSAQAARSMGKTRDELLGRSMWEVFPDAGDDFRFQCERAWRKQKPVSFDYYSPALGRWFETFLYPSSGRLSIQGHDITDRKRVEQSLRDSELRLRTVLENTPEGYAIYDAERRIEYINPVSLKLTGRKLEDLVGKRDEDLWPEEISSAYVPQLKRVYETGLPENVELDTIAVSGDRFTKLLKFLPIKDAKGTIQHVLAATVDLTERKRFEHAMVEADRRKDEFLALLSHELRNPLTPIRYSLLVLDRAPPASEQASRAKAIIGRQVDQLTRIVDDLLDVTRISRGKIELQRSPLPLGDLVRRTAEDYRALFAANGIEVEIDVSKKQLIVDGDPARVAQIIGNLLQNAAKFTPRGGHVWLTLKADKARRMAVISVRDTGVGISADVLPQLFQPFEQGANTLSRASGGLGLGLALVKALVEMHAGNVEARSEGPGTGAEIIVRLPLSAGSATDGADPKEPAALPVRRVLIIEDNVDSARSLCEVLKLEKHEVEVCHDGPAGLAKARSFKPDIVFCDIGLPEMDGYRVAEAFRSDKQLRSVYLVALTGYALPADRAKAMAAGFDRHLAKPPSLAKLRDVLTYAVRGR
jgi:PAS domain S-box-containing protein